MHWGEELWDGFDRLSKYFNEGIQFYELYEEFLKERCIIENSYAKSLRKLIKNYEFNKKNISSSLPTTYHIITSTTSAVTASGVSPTIDDKCKLTYLRSFNRNLNEIKDIAGQHELVAENLQKKIIERLSASIKAFKEDRRKCIDDKDKFHSTYLNCEESLKKSKSKYEYAFREAEKAKEVLQKVEQDDNSSRMDIRKQQGIYEQKARTCDQHKADYANQMCLANTMKSKYYDEQLPTCVNVLQDLEQKRLNLFKDLSNECISIETEVIPRIERCYKEMQNAINDIIIENDTDCVVVALKTGYMKPADHIFEDLNNPQRSVMVTDVSGSNGNTLNNSNSSGLNMSGEYHQNNGTVSRAAKYKTLGRLRGLLKPKTELEILYDLPPQQQKKELKKKMEVVLADIAKENKEREGLLKLKEIYENNEKFGNSDSALTALKNNEEKLNNLNAVLNKYKMLYDECERNGTLSKAKTLPNQNNQNKLMNMHNTSQTLPLDSDKQNDSMPSTPNALHNNSITSLKQSPRDKSICSDTLKYASTESFDDDLDETSNSDTNSQKQMSSVKNDDLPKTKQISVTMPYNDAQYEHIDNTLSVIDNNNINNKMPVLNVQHQQETFEEEYEEQIIGKAQVLYDFKGTVQNSISIEESELLNVMEKDSGDGWTLVKRLKTGEKGYVPTDYIRVEYF